MPDYPKYERDCDFHVPKPPKRQHYGYDDCEIHGFEFDEPDCHYHPEPECDYHPEPECYEPIYEPECDYHPEPVYYKYEKSPKKCNKKHRKGSSSCSSDKNKRRYK